jgi:polysaccharide export outer membrane protein
MHTTIDEAKHILSRIIGFACLAFLLVGCTAGPNLPTPPTSLAETEDETPLYVIGPLDTLSIFVWRAPDLSTTVPVRPDGRISMPLVDSLVAAGKTPEELARELEEALADFVQSPIVNVFVTSFGFGSAAEQTVRVVGSAQMPTAVPYRSGMTLLDVLIAVGGLSEFAAGNRAVLVRGGSESYALRLRDLIDQGDMTADVPVRAGDIVIIPQSLL